MRLFGRKPPPLWTQADVERDRNVRAAVMRANAATEDAERLFGLEATINALTRRERDRRTPPP